MRNMYWQLGNLGTISVFVYRHRETNNNNNNYYYYYYYYYYLFQFGCYPVAVVILHVNKT